MLTAGLIALGFLLGSIPFGLIISRARGIDIRQHGSKNIGATNVGRVLGRRFGFLCFGLDFAKGFAPTLAAGWLLGGLGALNPDTGIAWPWLAVMSSTILGHMFSPWVGFKGGKGVATGFGALAAVWPALGVPVLSAFVLWAVVLFSTRFMGLASCVAALSLPIGVLISPRLVEFLAFTRPEPPPQDRGDLQFGWSFLAVSTALSLFVVWKHRGNIQRMLKGTELRLGGSGPSSANTKLP